MAQGAPVNQLFSRYIGYWNSLEKLDKIPALSALFDNADARILPWLNIVDVEQDAVQTIRFAGTKVVDYFGQDLTRTNFLDLLSGQARSVIQRSHREIVQRPCGAYHKSVCSTANGREFELLAMGLPLARAKSLRCVAWLLEPQGTVGYGEVRVLVQRVLKWSWVDLGYGTPAP